MPRIFFARREGEGAGKCIVEASSPGKCWLSRRRGISGRAEWSAAIAGTNTYSRLIWSVNIEKRGLVGLDFRVMNLHCV